MKNKTLHKLVLLLAYGFPAVIFGWSVAQITKVQSCYCTVVCPLDEIGSDCGCPPCLSIDDYYFNLIVAATFSIFLLALAAFSNWKKIFGGIIYQIIGLIFIGFVGFTFFLYLNYPNDFVIHWWALAPGITMIFIGSLFQIDHKINIERAPTINPT